SIDSHPDSISPVERLGTLILAARTTPGQQHVVRVREEDSPDIDASFCVEAAVIDDSDIPWSAASSGFEAAHQAAREQRWEEAFERFRRASLQFDRAGKLRGAAAARHAMAEISYLRLDRKRDSFALAGESLSVYVLEADPLRLGPLLGLQAKALLDTPGLDP